MGIWLGFFDNARIISNLTESRQGDLPDFINKIFGSIIDSPFQFFKGGVHRS